MRDSSDRESVTLGFVTVAFVVVTLAYAYLLLAGKTMPTLMDYASAVGAILLIWLGREWRVTHYDVKAKGD